jgi:4-azaleucine resistance transporter AzlC
LNFIITLHEITKLLYSWSMNKYCFTRAFKVSLPVLFGYLAIGIAFGLILVEAGYPWWLAPIMSISMYAGAGQYIAIGLFSAGTSLSMIILTELLVNIRHIVYGLSLITKFNCCGKWKPFLIFALTDETYSLLTSVEAPDNVPKGTFYGIIALLDYLYWIIGGIIGALAGSIIPFSMKGVDFALTALFTVLTIDQIKSSKDFISPLLGILATILSILLWKNGIIKDSNNILLSSISIGLAVLIITRHKEWKKTDGDKIATKGETE